MNVVGLDIGGANLKAVHHDGTSSLQPFELWKHPDRLPAALTELLRTLPVCDTLAVTMTGELCDCFATRREGVTAILRAVDAVAEGRAVRVWTTAGRFVDPRAAAEVPLQVAAANWLALATFAARYAGDAYALVIDVGSTTTDVVPLVGGRPAPRGRTDPERLAHQELIYTGARRTPACALLDGHGAAEFFATTLDAHLLLGHLPEDENDCHTADGRPATRTAAHARLAHMLCGDEETVAESVTHELAGRICRRQLELIGRAVRQVVLRLPGEPTVAVLSGSGAFLARLALRTTPGLADLPTVDLDQQLGPALSAAACAHAVADLAAEGQHD